MSPHRFVVSRQRGARKPAGRVSVAGSSRFFNPFRPRKRSVEANAAAITRYVREVLGNDLVADARANLAGRPLGCYCPLHLPCHTDVLLLVAAGADPEDALAEVLARHGIGGER